MVIDFHTHTFPEKIAKIATKKLSFSSHIKLFSDGTEKSLLNSMKESGIETSVVLPVVTNPQKTKSINDYSIARNREQNDLLFFGGIHPQNDEYKEELKRISDNGIKGIKIHPVFQNTDIDDIKYLRILDKAGELGLIVVSHAGDDIGFPGVVNCSPLQIENAIKQVGDVKIVLAHMGGWKNWDDVERLVPYNNVYIDTAFSFGEFYPADDYYSQNDCKMLNEERFFEIINKFGHKRTLFGTDSPWASQKEYLNRFLKMPFNEEKINDILYMNAEKILKTHKQKNA